MMDAHDSDFEECLDSARELLWDEESGDLFEANELVNRALLARPASPEAWLLKCQVLSALGDDLAALAAIEMAIRRSPRLAAAHYWHGVVLADLERYADALRAVERAFRHVCAEDDWLLEELYYQKAMVLHAVGRKEAAMRTYEAGLRRYPDSAILKSGLEPLHRERVRRSFKVIPGGLR